LGNAYRNRILGDRAENLESALAAYQRALEVFTPEADPIECLRTSRNLGNLHFTQGNWQPAIDVYENAIVVVELSRSRAKTNDRRQEIMTEAIEFYQKQVQAYINIGQWDKAIETVERSKARNLIELLANRDLYPKGDIPQETIAQLDRLWRTIPSLERQLQVVRDLLSINTSELEEPQRQSLEESQRQLQLQLQSSGQQLDGILNQIKLIDPSFSLTQKVEQIQFSDIQNLVNDRTAIIEWYITSDKILTFIVTANSRHPLVEQASVQQLEDLANWQNDYLATYYQETKEWKANLASNLKQLAEILNIDRILAQIDDIFNKQGGKCDRLILIPHRILHLLPLHALPLANGDLFCDQFTISYAPSCQLLYLIQTRERPEFYNFFAIQNPNRDLGYSDIEVQTIKQYFTHTKILDKDAATKDTLNNQKLDYVHCLHFSGHGNFNINSPLESSLVFADEPMTLAEIFNLDLNQCRLVTLSTSETALTDWTSSSDEYISFPGAFLFAGSNSVIGSLWALNDISSAFLMIRFYQNLHTGSTVAVALNQAQLWLRDITKIELIQWIKENLLPLDATVNMNLRRRFHKLSDDAQPFREPFYWAAFCAIGQ